jgi:hypothetical protein
MTRVIQPPTHFFLHTVDGEIPGIFRIITNEKSPFNSLFFRVSDYNQDFEGRIQRGHGPKVFYGHIIIYMEREYFIKISLYIQILRDASEFIPHKGKNIL